MKQIYIIKATLQYHLIINQGFFTYFLENGI